MNIKKSHTAANLNYDTAWGHQLPPENINPETRRRN
jgi:hypothetical protein